MSAFYPWPQSTTIGPYKPRTGPCMNHALAILAAPALIYSICYLYGLLLPIFTFVVYWECCLVILY